MKPDGVRQLPLRIEASAAAAACEDEAATGGGAALGSMARRRCTMRIACLSPCSCSSARSATAWAMPALGFNEQAARQGGA